MHSTFRYFISIIFLLLICSFSFSQAKETPKKVAKPKKDFAPTGIRVGTDLIDLGKTFAGKTFKGWEVNGDVDFANYYLAADIGSWSKKIVLSNGEYSNGGNYFRIGADINLLGKDPDKNMFFFGFRYGRSLFHESLNYLDTTSNKIYVAAPYQVKNANVSGGWAELTSGLRVKIWKGLWMGYTARIKFAPGTKGNDPSLATYDMPGYGIISNKPWWGFNYQVFWRFAWKKNKPVVK
ncbi:MAG: hypothetical protein HY015_06650 [Bacteroidetes bacterium]|nr:hypothetical protein [Bacteroidota bacterium]MBI3482643.1 hypothetical protein [Bacteroidota bacterium]